VADHRREHRRDIGARHGDLVVVAAQLAVQARERFVTPRAKRLDHDLGVALRAKRVTARAQLGTQLDVVEDLTVEDDDNVAGAGVHRLHAPREVDDRKPRMRELTLEITIFPACVRAAVAEHAPHPAQRLRIGRASADKHTDDAAHGRSCNRLACSRTKCNLRRLAGPFDAIHVSLAPEIRQRALDLPDADAAPSKATVALAHVTP